MKKYRLTIKSQKFEYENTQEVIQKARSLMEVGIWLIETDSIEVMSKREEKLSGEGVKEEVKRVEKQREFIGDDEDIDELGLDD